MRRSLLSSTPSPSDLAPFLSMLQWLPLKVAEKADFYRRRAGLFSGYALTVDERAWECAARDYDAAARWLDDAGDRLTAAEMRRSAQAIRARWVRASA